MSNVEAPATKLPQTGFLRIKQIIGDKKKGIPAIIPVHTSTWWRGIREGTYPKGYKIGPRATGWRVEDIKRLIEGSTQNG